MSNRYGYSGTAGHTQAIRSNSGVFSPNDIIDLESDNVWFKGGQLDLISTQTFSSSTAVFSDLQEGTYTTHLFTFTDIHFGSQTELDYLLSNDGGTSYETNYQFANQRGISDGSFQERKSTGAGGARLCGDIDAGAHSLANGYMYLYNAGNISRFTFSTSHMVYTDFQDHAAMEVGGQVYPAKDVVSAIKFGEGVSAGSLTSATISLYGIKELS